MIFLYLKDLKKSDLLICLTFFLLYTFLHFYYLVIGEIDFTDFIFRTLLILSLFVYLKSEYLLNNNYILLKPLHFCFKYLVYICLTLGFLFEILPSLRKNICFKKQKVTSFLFQKSFSKNDCKFNQKTNSLL